MGSKNIEKLQFTKTELKELAELIELKKIKIKLEKEGIENVKKLTPILEKDLTQIIKNGEKEFVEKFGRNMTYSEMREMYG